MPDSPSKKRTAFNKKPGIGFTRRDVVGHMRKPEDLPTSTDADPLQKDLAKALLKERVQRLDSLIDIDERIGAMDEYLREELADFSIAFDPKAEPSLADAVDTLRRPVGNTPTDPYSEDYPSSLTFEDYDRGLTLMLDAYTHVWGIDPVAIIFAEKNDAGELMVPVPGPLAAANCKEKAELSEHAASEDAELQPLATVLRKQKQKTFLDILRMLWQLILYFIYGFIITMLEKLKLTKIPFGVGKKVKKFIKKLKKKQANIMKKITGAGDAPETKGPPEITVGPPDTTGSEGDEFWTGIECIQAAKVVTDFVHEKAASEVATNKDTTGRGELIQSHVMNQISKDKLEANKAMTIMEIPKEDSDGTVLDEKIAKLQDSTDASPRNKNRYKNRNAKEWMSSR